MPRRLIDLSHTIRDGLLTYPGIPPPKVGVFLSREASRKHYARGTEFEIGTLELVANTGTYIDAPFHRYHDGHDVAGFELERVADLEGVVIQIGEREGRAIGPEWFSALDLEDRAVLVHTGWSSRFGSRSYFEDYPFLTAEAAELLVQRGARLVGIDALNVDDNSGGERPVHSRLLAEDIAIVEHLTGLGELPERGFRFFAVPVKVEGLGSFPVRAFALIEEP